MPTYDMNGRMNSEEMNQRPSNQGQNWQESGSKIIVGALTPHAADRAIARRVRGAKSQVRLWSKRHSELKRPAADESVMLLERAKPGHRI